MSNWYISKFCPYCGGQLATDGKIEWCTGECVEKFLNGESEEIESEDKYWIHIKLR